MDFSFLWAKGNDEEYEIIEVTFESGPLNMQLGYDQQTRKIYVHGFQPTPDGGKGVAEASGQIQLRDELISVNAKEINGASLRWTVSLIMQSLWPMTLQFRRPAKRENAMLQEYIDVEKLSVRENAGEGSQNSNPRNGSKKPMSRTNSASSAETQDIQLTSKPKRDFAPGITTSLDRVLSVIGDNNIQLINQAACLDAALVRVKNQTTSRVKGIVAFHKEFEKLPALKQEVVAIASKVRELKILLQMTEEALLQKERKKIVKDFALQSQKRKQDTRADEDPSSMSLSATKTLLPSQMANMVGSSIVEQFSTMSRGYSTNEGLIGRATSALFRQKASLKHDHQNSQNNVYINSKNPSSENTYQANHEKMDVSNSISIEDILVEHDTNGGSFSHSPSKQKHTFKEGQGSDNENNSDDSEDDLLCLDQNQSLAEPVTELDSFYDNPW